MNSGGHRGFTVVTIVTLIFSPVFAHHHWLYRLTSWTSESHVEQCVARQPCPAFKRIVNIVKPELPPNPPKHGQKGEDARSTDYDAGDFTVNGVSLPLLFGH
jgi:hypothetical protein